MPSFTFMATVHPLIWQGATKLPRAITPDERRKSDADWEVGRIHIKYGAAIGAGTIILPDITIGRFALVGAGAVVTKDVPDHGLVIGSPARFVGYVCKCGRRLRSEKKQQGVAWHCDTCREAYDLPEILR